MTRVRLTDNAQTKRMFLIRLNPAYTPLVYSQNPADLDAAINSIQTIKIRYNFASGKVPKDISTTTVSTPKNMQKWMNLLRNWSNCLLIMPI
jgi:hypothetical protein